MVRNEITEERISTFFDGYDPQERIVNLTYDYKDDFVKIYYRDENDNKCMSRQPFKPFVWAKLRACTKLCDGDRDEIKRLMKEYGIKVKSLEITNNDGVEINEMKDGYRYMFYAVNPMSYSTFLEFFKKAGCPIYGKRDDKAVAKKDEKLYLAVTPQEQYMISTGKRFFKGYDDYNELLRMIFDLETEGLDPKKDRIKLNGIRLNRPVTIKGKEYKDFNKIFRLEGKTEKDKDAFELKIIDTMLKIIYTFQPDIITAHNGENFDWSFIIERCIQLGTSIEAMSAKYFGGQTIYKNKRETILKLGGEIETFNQTVVPGIIVTDSLHAVRRAQALDSNMLESNLKYATRYSNMVKSNRVYVPGEIIDKTLNDKYEHYAFNDSNGDWYLYDPSYVGDGKKKSKIVKDELYYSSSEAKKEYDEYIDSLISKKEIPQSDSLFADDWSLDEKMKEREVLMNTVPFESWKKDKIAELKEKKTKKENEKFVLRTRNELFDGYTLVSGKYIVERYLADDLWECDKVEHKYNSTNFLICKLLPIPFQKVCTMGTAGQWKAILLAWSYENNLAIPPFGETKTFTGGLSRLLSVGFVDKVAKFDYNSLYPSIILTWKISDKKDLMGVMLAFLKHVLTNREKYKKLKKEAGKKKNAIKEQLVNFNGTQQERDVLEKGMQHWAEEESRNDNKQMQLKVLGNSFFGSYGCPSIFPHSSIACAERTTCTGRQSLRLMIYYFSKLGYKPIVGDSFTEDTLVYVKHKETGEIKIVPISKLIDENEIHVDELGREYDYSEKPYYVLCRSGWVEPEYIYRHKTDKVIYEVKDREAVVKVTEDHSLFDENRNKIKPTDVTENTKLEYYTKEIS